MSANPAAEVVVLLVGKSVTERTAASKFRFGLSLLFLLLLGLATWGGSARGAERVQVPITITVLPIAVVDLPDGAEFTLRVPHTPHCPPFRNGGKWITSVFWNYVWESDWRRWTDDEWDLWGADYRWDDWGADSFRQAWFRRCKGWLSERYWPVVRPARIPFTVRGNALASVAVAPSNFLRIRSGKWLGRAVGPGNRALGYDTVLHFPLGSQSYRWLDSWDLWEDWDDWRNWRGFGSLPWWSRWTHLPGIEGATTPQLTADMQQRNGKAYGVIYAVARRDWTADGKKAKAGDYRGVIEITIVAANN